MTRFSITAEFDCDPKTYWEIFWDEAFNVEQYEKMQCARSVLTQRDEGAVLVRDQEIQPTRAVPGVLAKLIGGAALCYVEHSVFTKPDGPLSVEIQVPAAGARFQMKGQYAVVALGAERCRREFVGDCLVKIPLVGGLAEQTILSSLQENYEIAAAVHRSWIARRKS